MRASSGATLVVLLASCSSTRNGVASIEVRGAATIETLGPLSAALMAGAAGSRSTYSDTDNVDGLGGGLEAAVNSTFVDVIAGFQQRKIDDTWLPELSVGLRKRFGPDESPVYVFGLLRSDQRGTDDSRTFNGFALGLGLIAQLDRHWFVDMNIAWEHTDHLDIDPENSEMNEGVLQIGLGWAF